MADRIPSGGQPEDVRERRLRRSWLSLVAAFAALAVFTALTLVVPDGRLSIVALGLVGVVGVVGLIYRRVIAELEDGRRMESESFQRILRGLSRSVSPDAIVNAIVEDLGVAAGADHTVVVRLRADARILEATLVSSRAGVPSSTTMLPISDLEDPGPGRFGGGRMPVAVPIQGAGSLAPELDGTVIAGVGARTHSRGVVDVPATSERSQTRDEAMLGSREGAEAPPSDRVPSSEPARRPRRTVVGVGASVGALRASVAGHAIQASPAGSSPAAARIAEHLAFRVRNVYGLRSTLAQALVTDQGVVGAIVLSRRTGEEWTPAARRLVLAAAEEASAALARAYSYREAEARASTDALTGLPNRRYFDEFCGLLARRRRADDAVGVLMIDVDHFKQVNDRFGHPVGDQVLRAVAAAITGAVREGDVPARFGGEEFAVLLRNPGRDVAMEVGERVRAAVGALDLSVFGPPGVTVSVGVAVAQAADQPISDLVDEADRALYRAKRLGRDRVVPAA